VLDWLEKTVLIFRSRLTQEQQTTRLVSPEQFMAHLADWFFGSRLVDALIGPSDSDFSQFLHEFATEEESFEWV
jgi:hypothetical protein